MNNKDTNNFKVLMEPIRDESRKIELLELSKMIFEYKENFFNTLDLSGRIENGARNISFRVRSMYDIDCILSSVKITFSESNQYDFIFNKKYFKLLRDKSIISYGEISSSNIPEICYSILSEVRDTIDRAELKKLFKVEREKIRMEKKKEYRMELFIKNQKVAG